MTNKYNLKLNKIKLSNNKLKSNNNNYNNNKIKLNQKLVKLNKVVKIMKRKFKKYYCMNKQFKHLTIFYRNLQIIYSFRYNKQRIKKKILSKLIQLQLKKKNLKKMRY